MTQLIRLFICCILVVVFPVRLTNKMNFKINWKSAVTSWYGEKFNGNLMANGAVFNSKSLIIASRKHTFGTKLMLNYNNNTVIGVVSDRGPWITTRELDVSEQIALELGIREMGVAPVRFLQLGD